LKNDPGRAVMMRPEPTAHLTTQERSGGNRR
jgi:hypothetical protein